MLTCPHCNEPVELRQLQHQDLFSSHRICPACDGAFDVDSDTKRRQGIFIIVAVVSFVLTLLMFSNFLPWAPFAVVSYAILGVGIHRANKKVRLVKYPAASDEAD